MSRKRDEMSSLGSLLLDNDKPRSDDRSLRTPATSARYRCRWRRASRWRRNRTALGLKEIRVVGLRIHGDRLRTRDGCDRRHHGVLVWRILVNDCDVAFAAIRNEDRLL